MANPPSWPTVLDDIARRHRKLQETLLWLDEDEYGKPLPALGKSPVQLMADLRRQQGSIVHEVRAYLKETPDGGSLPRWQDADFLRSSHQCLTFFQARMEEAAAAPLPEPLSVQVRTQCQALMERMAGARRAVADYWFSLARWGRGRLREFVAAQFDDLLDSVGGLPEDALCANVIAGTWTAREILAHVLVWEEFGWEILHQWPCPDPQSLQPWIDTDIAQVDIAQVNQRMIGERAHLDLIDVVGDLYTYRRRTLQFLDACPDARLDSVGDYGGGVEGTLSGLLLQMALHRNEHAQAIWAAREAGRLA